ncbi:MAG: GatB/YqeY domain-containing protein [Thermaurantimonas sp.]|uniref:GatB/YqeY domain-containing protein n=1 Tax=Thermaurantimonas sp. TaxID=2681568 RepID=UPI00391AD1E2
MSLENQINEKIKEAMKAKDKDRLNALRAIKSAILLAHTEKGAAESLSEDTELKILQKLHKQRKESYEIFVQQNREDLAAEELAQMRVIEEFLPKPLTEEELNNEILKLIDDLGASSPADFGKVMGVASKKLAGRADGKAISEAVKKILNK